MKMTQLTLFDKPVTEMDALWNAINELKFSHEKVRKRLFREIKDLEDEVLNLKSENDRLNFCKESA